MVKLCIVSTARVPHVCMPMASSSPTCYYIGLESTDIDSEQAQQESAGILNVLRAPMPAEFVESEKYRVYQWF